MLHASVHKTRPVRDGISHKHENSFCLVSGIAGVNILMPNQSFIRIYIGKHVCYIACAYSPNGLSYGRSSKW